ncbi:MAG: hypothetical protein JSU86_04640 [Phycisphaerales bacterium]|nr:MAG: hypothetical protein JSU86_04640 [Phycisphaerales bacterium]
MTRRARIIGVLCLCPALAAGCGEIPIARPAPLFNVPLSIEGEPIGSAIIDTGGGYELLLRDSFGLQVIDTVEVLAFGGKEAVGVTEGFQYTAGGWDSTTDAALVGLSVCDCNGLGFHFFRKTGAVLGLDFANPRAMFLPVAPTGGVTIPFQPPPSFLTGFDSAFVQIEIASGGDTNAVLGLLDTGTNASVMRRGVVGTPSSLTPDRLDVTVTVESLGTVAVQMGLFETAGLPDVILGTDVMRTWSDRWYFFFAKERGTVTAFPHAEGDAAPAGTISAAR